MLRVQGISADQWKGSITMTTRTNNTRHAGTGGSTAKRTYTQTARGKLADATQQTHTSAPSGNPYNYRLPLSRRFVFVVLTVGKPLFCSSSNYQSRNSKCVLCTVNIFRFSFQGMKSNMIKVMNMYLTD